MSHAFQPYLYYWTPPIPAPVHFSANVFKYIYPDFNNAEPPLLCRSWITPTSTHSLWLQNGGNTFCLKYCRDKQESWSGLKHAIHDLSGSWDFLAKLLATTIGGINNECETRSQRDFIVGGIQYIGSDLWRMKQ